MMHRALVLALAALPSSLAATLQVKVGANGLTYDPPFVNAAVDDYVVFTFEAKNHTVTQSSFAAPCSPLDGGLNSGFHPVSDPNNLPTFQVHVTDTSKPMWFYCAQTNPVSHCAQGMVFAINCPTDPNDPNSLSAFQAKAKASGGDGGANGSTTATTPDSTTTAPPSTDDSYTTPPPQSWTLGTAVVSSGASTWTTTYTSYDGTPSPTFAATPQDHKIVVGVDGNLAYGPANVSAAIGDTVTFEFHAKNHTVTQSSFSAPCQPLQDTAGKPGFKSGFQPVSQDQTSGFPTFQITINDTAPIWGYCGQTNPVVHCGKGMVFSINAVETGANNFAAFQALAERINGTSGTGTGTTTGSGPSSTTSTKPSGAISSVRVNVAAVLMSLFAGVAYFL